ncbi:MAG TPA: PrsW family glutamic-type intramembrane protease [Polyangiaceae bacterium]|jgi:RsiW-degrading membrane proteinase PrsW (M82 family)/multisubunit Na+/H+ antiporter MnhG subunit
MVALSAILVSLFPLALGFLVWRRVSRLGRVSRRLTILMAAAGALVSGLSVYVEHALLTLTGLSFEVAESGVGGALLATFLLAAPLEEALKVGVVWPLYRTRRIDGPRLGVCYASAAAAGFAAIEEIVAVLESHGSGISVLRALVSAPAHLFFAGVWGYTLGLRGNSRSHWFSLAWLSATLLHGLYDHIVWGRGPGLLVTVIPLFVFMGLGTWVALRDVAPTAHEGRESLMPEPPSLRVMREALRPVDHKLMARWIVVGAFVTLGLIIALLALAVVVGRRLGVDFSLADESDVRSSGPLILLGAAVLLAFPIAGYLVAKASSAHSVLEPALAAGCALAALVAMLSLTAPLGVLFALAVAPLAFGLACGGAWFGLER